MHFRLACVTLAGWARSNSHRATDLQVAHTTMFLHIRLTDFANTLVSVLRLGGGGFRPR